MNKLIKPAGAIGAVIWSLLLSASIALAQRGGDGDGGGGGGGGGGDGGGGAGGGVQGGGESVQIIGLDPWVFTLVIIGAVVLFVTLFAVVSMSSHSHSDTHVHH